MRILLGLFLIILIATVSLGQTEDNIWLIGATLADNFDPSIIQDSTGGATNIDFNYDPVKIYYDSTRLADFSSTNASLYDKVSFLLR